MASEEYHHGGGGDARTGNGSHGTTGLVMRALITTREAGSIIGRGGANIAAIRNTTGVRAGVSKLVEGVGERVLELRSGDSKPEEIARAVGMMVQSLLDNPPVTPAGGGVAGSPSRGGVDGAGRSRERASIKLLISHTLMGSIIGRGGTKIKQIQDETGVRLLAQKELLPQSTERIVEVVSNSADAGAIEKAVLHIAQALLEDGQRGGGAGTIYYQPVNRTDATDSNVFGRRFTGRRSLDNEGVEATMHDAKSPPSPTKGQLGPSVADTSHDPDARTQSIPLPADMVGCIIGKGGAKINEIRRQSGSRISIAKEPHDETGERLFTVTGNAQSIEKALLLIYSQLEDEKARRLNLMHVEAT